MMMHQAQPGDACPDDRDPPRRQCKLASFFGLHEIGKLRAGKRADIVVFELDEVKCRDMESASTCRTAMAAPPGASPARPGSAAVPDRVLQAPP